MLVQKEYVEFVHEFMSTVKYKYGEKGLVHVSDKCQETCVINMIFRKVLLRHKGRGCEIMMTDILGDLRYKGNRITKSCCAAFYFCMMSIPW